MKKLSYVVTGITKYSCTARIWKDGENFTGYIHDTSGTLAKPNKQWNTKTKVKREAIQIVKNRVKELYEHGTPAKITHERSTKSIAAILNHWLTKKYIPGLRRSNSEQKNKKYISNYQGSINNIVKSIGKISVFDFDEDHFMDFIQHRRDAGASENVILKDSNILKTAIKFSLKDKGYGIVKDIKIKLKGDKRLPVDHPRNKAMTVSQVEMLLNEIKPPFQYMYELQFKTGSRPSEIRELKWQDVDTLQGAITIWDHKTLEKTEKPLVKPIKNGLLEQMIELKKTAPVDEDGVFLNDYVFSAPRHNRPISSSAASDAFSRAIESLPNEAGFVDHSKTKKNGQPVHLFTPHTLRHACITFLAKRGYSAKQIQAITGHSTTQMTERYQVFSMKDKEHMSNNIESDFNKSLDEEKITIESNEGVKEKVDEKLVKNGQIWSDDKTSGETSTEDLKMMLLKIQVELNSRESI
ncbi:site-specific integrase [bacterium]|nr:site-specific integrase [bacterium]